MQLHFSSFQSLTVALIRFRKQKYFRWERISRNNVVTLLEFIMMIITDYKGRMTSDTGASEPKQALLGVMKRT